MAEPNVQPWPTAGNDPAPCPQCPVRQRCSASGQPGIAPLAAVHFLVPLALAFAGAALGGSRQVDQFLGAVIGLGAGMAATAWWAWLRQRRTGESA